MNEAVSRDSFLKNTLRKTFLAAREAMSREEVIEKSDRILSRLTAHPLYRDCACLYLYADVRKEVRTGPLIRRALSEGRRVALPRIEGKKMDFYYITDEKELSPGRFGIPEPGSSCQRAEDEEALLIVPGVAFDSRGGRLGYGGGFYDRYLAEHRRQVPAALAYDIQIADRIPSEPWDHRITRIFTETVFINVKEGTL
ncbi:MAG: 5-formyltetrahydrofolate cyclo-ligase [Lachnospiraceae bacterium]|nr:5-formyltetrahydrofolate cyclo-ligase [Lachnospiraceae bacterium]